MPENTQQNKRKPKLTPEMEARKWKKGESGNPGGRPRKLLTDDLIARLEKNPDLIAALNLAQIKKAKAGDTRAYQALRDGIEGKPLSQVEIPEELGKIILIGITSA